MPRPWIQQVVQPSDSTIVRTTIPLESRTQYLKDRLDASELSRGVFQLGATLDPTLLEGQPVYYNDDTQRFEAALAATEIDEATGSLVSAASAECVGILYFKEFANKGDILLAGNASMTLDNSAGESASAGRYYLSSADPGRLTLQKPGFSVPVLFYDGQGQVYVQPVIRDFVETHVHISIPLVCQPAGHSTAPSPGERHEIFTPDSTQPGWLPANSDVFNGLAPARAAFGYNLALHPELNRLWPPIPTQAAELVWFKGDRSGGSIVPQGADGLVVVDANGIWWMSDCYGDVPWPTMTNTSLSSYPSEPSLSEPECPRFDKMRLILHFNRMSFSTEENVVTSLQPYQTSPVRIVDCNGETAQTGDLFVKLDTDFSISDNDAVGNLAFKDLDGQKFKRGWVVSGLRSTNDRVTITGSRTTEIDGLTYSQGLLSLAVNLDPGQQLIPSQLVRLNNAEQEFYEDVPYVSLPSGRASSVRCIYRVPVAGLPSNPKFKLRLQLFGLTTGTFPGLTATYRIISRPTGQVVLPTSDSALAISTALAITSGKYREVESDNFTVAAGDTVLVTLSRTASDGYSGKVGLLDLSGLLYPGG